MEMPREMCFSKDGAATTRPHPDLIALIADRDAANFAKRVTLKGKQIRFISVRSHEKMESTLGENRNYVHLLVVSLD
jgi:hypothetical protein